MSEAFTPCWIIRDGENRPFDSWILPEEIAKINACGGLSNCEQIMLRETPQKPIPEDFKNGLTMCRDIWVCLIPGPAFDYGKS